MSSLREKMNRLRGISSTVTVETEPKEQTEEHSSAVTNTQDSKEIHVEVDLSHYKSDLMERMDGIKEIEDIEGIKDTEDIEVLSQEWELLGVRLAWNECGNFLIRKRVYPLHHSHGTHQLGDFAVVGDHLAALHQHRNRKNELGLETADDTPLLHAEQVLFLDLETTGLGVGAGNVPFMVGIAYFQQDKFIVEQYLIRHPAEELAMLRHLMSKLESFRWLVTYNGKTFDWPLLESRFIMNGLGRNIWQPMHLDLLHPSRSIWKNTLVSCKLSHVEEERLGITREEDVPGSLAPAIYFQFLADGDPLPLEGVFRHNEIDMLSLAVLAVRFGLLLSGEMGRKLELPVDPEERLRTGLWLERMSRVPIAEQLFASISDERAVRASTLLTLGLRDKKAGNWQRAVLLWQKAAAAMEQATIPSWAAHVELAMYYEHKDKDYQRAFDYASGALSLALRSESIVRNHGNGKLKAELQALRKRRERLLSKLDKVKSKA